MSTMTKREMTAIARKARKYGHYRIDHLRNYVLCPQCREQVTGWRTISSTTGRYSTVTASLDEAMLAHLPYCGEE
jgi:hypothetical protein